MKKIIITLSILIYSVSAAQIFVDPNGSDLNSGTIDNPLLTIIRAMDIVQPNTIIYLREGTYYYSSTIKTLINGEENKPIKLWAYNNEKPVIDFTNQPVSTNSRGIYINKNYWHIKGLEIRGAKDNGIYITGNYNKIENCSIHNCCDTGLQISGGGSNNVVVNCDSYNNYDSLTLGENADGFAPKLDIGPGNAFINCRAWENSDDGWDLYESDDPVVITNCMAFRNGHNVWGIQNFQGDGNGFKLGGNYVSGSHIITGSIAFDNKSKGFDQNNNTAGVILYNNTAFRNEGKNYSFTSNPNFSRHILKNNISFQGNISIADSSIVEKNSWQGFIVSINDFLSLDTNGVTDLRNLDGEINETNFLHLNLNSMMVDAGVQVGLSYSGTAPDLGAYETIGVQVENTSNNIINDFKLNQNFPNPFNPITNISFSINKSGFVNLTIYDILGNKVEELINDYLLSGIYNTIWFANSNKNLVLSSGIYFANLNYNFKQQTIKMILAK